MKNILSIENMLTSRGNASAHHFIIRTTKGEFLSSYTINVAFKPLKGKIQLDTTNWNISTTTTKYINKFLNETTASIRKKLISGEYELTDLNL